MGFLTFLATSSDKLVSEFEMVVEVFSNWYLMNSQSTLLMVQKEIQGRLLGTKIKVHWSKCGYLITAPCNIRSDYVRSGYNNLLDNRRLSIQRRPVISMECGDL